MYKKATRHLLLCAMCLGLCHCGDEEPVAETPAPDTPVQPEPAEQPTPPAAEEQAPLTPEQRYNGGADAPADAHAAIAWYQEFAEAGITDAHYKMGMCYYNTRSIRMNFVKAVECFRAAAEQGHPEACAKLAECYELGVGMEADAAEAAKWKNKQ